LPQNCFNNIENGGGGQKPLVIGGRGPLNCLSEQGPACMESQTEIDPFSSKILNFSGFKPSDLVVVRNSQKIGLERLKTGDWVRVNNHFEFI
jgi:hypothetical protein